MKVLVTGGAGFIGSAVARTLACRGDEVLSIDIGPPPRQPFAELPSSARLEFATGDLTEWAQIAQLIKPFSPDAIVHCAAIVGVLNSVSAPFATMRVNVEGSLNLIEAMRLFDVRRMVHISSEEIYGPFDSDIINEDHPARPVRPYGISKYAVEQLARDYVRNYGLDIQHVRTCWVYGPGLPRPRVPKILIDAIVEKRSLHIRGGAEFRVDHTYVDDCVDGILKVLDHQGHRHDAYNIATGTAPSISEIVATLKTLEPNADISVNEGEYEFTKGLTPVKKGALDIGRARQELGYSPRFTLEAGLGTYLDWRRSNPV